MSLKISIGTKVNTNKSGVCYVKDILPGGRFLVEFEDGYQKVTTRKSIKDGKIKNPYHPSVRGFGFLGEGDYKSYDGNKITKEYTTWSGMINRCFTSTADWNSSYVNCDIQPTWACFQVFAEWYNLQPFVGYSYDLDKDLLSKNNCKIYSEDTCLLLPKELNSSLAGLLLDNVKGYRYNTVTKHFHVSFYDNKLKKNFAKAFKKEEDAQIFYLENRLNKFNEIYEQYRDKIDPRAKTAIEERVLTSVQKNISPTPIDTTLPLNHTTPTEAESFTDKGDLR